MKKILFVLALLMVLPSVMSQEVELVSGTDSCLNDCETIYKISSSGDYLLDESSFWFEFRDSENMNLRHAEDVEDLFEFNVQWGYQINYTENVWHSYGLECVEQKNGTNCEEVGEFLPIVKQRYVWNNFTLPYLIPSKDFIYLRVSGAKKWESEIDNVLVIKDPDNIRANEDGYVKYDEYFWWGDNDLQHHLVSYYSFDNATVDDLTDDFGSNNLIDDQQPQPTTDGKINNASDFNGVDDDYNSDGVDIFDIPDGVAIAWINASSLSGNRHIADYGNSGGEMTMFASVSGNAKPRCRTSMDDVDRDAVSSVVINTSEWYFIACAYNGSTSSDHISVYLGDSNGNWYGKVGTKTGNLGNTDDVNRVFRIGERAANTGSNFDGLIDEIAIYDVDLTEGATTDDFIEAIWNASNGCNVALFNECNETITGGADEPPNISISFIGTVNETSSQIFTINFSHANVDGVSNVTGTNLTYNNELFNANDSEFGTAPGANWSWFEYNITVPLVQVNDTEIEFNFTYMISLVNGSQTINVTNQSNQSLVWAYYPSTVHFVTPVLEGEQQNLTVNISKNLFTNGVGILGRVEYNQTNLSTTLVVNTSSYEDRRTANFQTAFVSTTTTVQLRGWATVSFDGDAFDRNTTLNFTQQINNVNVTGGNPGCLDPSNDISAVLNFTFHDEFLNQTVVTNGSSQITVWTDNQSMNHTFGFEYAGVTFHEICIQEPVNFTADYFLQYGNISLTASPKYPIREFHKRQQPIDNITEQYHLYSLIEPNASTITFNVINTIEQPLPNIIVEAHKYNISNNSFRIVDTGLTDVNGQTQLKLHQADDFYKFILRNGSNGIILETTRFKLLFNEYFFRPRDPDFVGLDDIIARRNIERTLTYNNGTGIIRLTYNDPANASGTLPHCLQVVNLTNFNNTLVNIQCSQNQTGTFTFSLLGSNGSYIAKYTLGSDSTIIDTISIIRDIFRQLGKDGAFFGFILVGTMATAGMFVSASAGVFFALIGLVASMWMGLIDLAWGALMGVIIIGGMIALFMNKEP